MVDSFSKFSFTVTSKEKLSKTLFSTFQTIFRTFGAPIILHTDNRKEFVNTQVASLCEEFSIKHIRGRACCPWIQGQVERLNKTLKNKLSVTLRSRGLGFKWTLICKEMTYIYNQLRHETTKYNPFELFYGKRIR